MARIDMTGQVFGRLTVTGFSHTGERWRAHWNCVCECGNTTKVVRGDLVSGNTKSCGCWRVEDIGRRRTTHGEAGEGGKRSQLYTIWAKMLDRCTNPNNPKFARYSVRGVDPRWKSFENFRDDIIEHIGRRPSKEFSLHRIDNDMGYWMFHPVTGKPQTKWADASEQARIKEKRKGSSQYRGVSKRFKKYQINVTPLGGGQTHFGTFADEFEAALTRDTIVLELQTGDILNFPHLRNELDRYVACKLALAELEKPLPFPLTRSA